MSWLSKAWKGIKKGAKKVGSIAQKAAPALAFIPGVGTVAAAAIGGVGGLMSGGLSGAVKGAAGGALGGLGKYALGQVGGGTIGNFARNALLGGGSNPNGFDLGDVGSIAKLAGTGLGLYSGYKGYQQSQADSKQARALTDQAVAATKADADRANATWGQLDPLRAAYIQNALTFSDPTNPFAQAAAPALAAAPSMAAPPAGAPPMGPGGGMTSPGMIAAMGTPATRRPVEQVTY